MSKASRNGAEDVRAEENETRRMKRKMSKDAIETELSKDALVFLLLFFKQSSRGKLLAARLTGVDSL